MNLFSFFKRKRKPWTPKQVADYAKKYCTHLNVTQIEDLISEDGKLGERENQVIDEYKNL